MNDKPRPSTQEIQAMYDERNPDNIYTKQVRQFIATELLMIDY